MARATGTMGVPHGVRLTSGARRHVASRAPGRLRRALAAVAKTVGLGATFVLAAAGAVHLHVGLAAPRRFAAAQVNSILESTFAGKIVVHRIGELSLTRLGQVDAEVLDPEGNRALLAYGVDARLGTFTLLRSLVAGDTLVVDIPELDIRGLEVVVKENEAGELSLVRAFEPREPEPATEETAGGGTEVSIRDIHLDHAWVHGGMSAVPVIDADVDDVRAGFGRTPDATDIDVKRLRLRARGMPGRNPEGRIEARASLPSDPDGDTRVSARYEGQVGEVPVVVDAAMDGKKVDAVVDVPSTVPAAIEALAPGQIKLGAIVSAHVEVHGELPLLRPEVHARIGEGEIAVTGTVTLPDETRAETAAFAKVRVKDLDLAEVQEGAPGSRLTAGLEAHVTSWPGGRLEGDFQLENHVGEVAGQVVPAVSAQGEFTERSVVGAARIAERGAPTAVAFSLQPRGDAGSPTELDFEVETEIASLRAVSRLGRIGDGSARVRVKGEMDLETKALSADVHGTVAGVDVGGVRLASGVIAGSASGTIEQPRFLANVSGAGLRAGGYTFTKVRVHASGSPEDVDVSARLLGDEKAPHVTARAHLSNREALAVSGGFVRLEREDVATWATVRSVHVAGGTVDVRGVTLNGLGDPVEASVRVTPGGMTVKAKAEDVDVARLAVLLGEDRETQGRLALDVDARTRGREVTGRVKADLTAVSLRRYLRGGEVHVDTSIQDRQLTAKITAGIAETGDVEITTTGVKLGGPAMAPSAWMKATGAVAVRGDVDLRRALALLPEDARPVDTASGRVKLEGSAARGGAEDTPTLDLFASTKDLVIVGKQEKHRNADGTVTLGPEPFRTAGVDGAVALKLEGSGQTDVSVKLHDRRGDLVAASVGARLPIATLLKAPERLVGLIQNTPIVARVAVPRRSLDAMPSALGEIPVKGDVELTADFEGTPQEPKLTLVAKGQGLVAKNAAHCVRGVDVETTVAYDGAKADIGLRASRDGREFLSTAADVKVRAADALAGGTFAWDASADVTLSELPLDAVGGFIDRPIMGTVTGKVAVADLHRAASLDADLALSKLGLDRARFPTGKVKVTVKDGTLSATARLDQADGYMETTASAAMTWGAEVAPALDTSQPVNAHVVAKNFRANALLPFVQGTFTELDGRIDTNTKIHVEPGAKDGRMDSAVVLRDGVLETPSVGERFHGIEGKLIIKPWGTVRFDDFKAEASTGSLTAHGTAVLDGIQLKNARAEIRIEDGQSIPITVEGVPMGRAYGTIKAAASMSPDGERLDVAVDIPTLHVELPQSTGHSVQPLEPNEKVRVGRHVRGGDFTLIALEPPEEEPSEPVSTGPVVHATIKLGQDVEVRRDTTVQVVAHGEVKVTAARETDVDGRIVLDRGKLELQGKMFVIDRGIVTFVGDDPADPTIIATAYWDAPDQTRVFIDFAGRVSEGKLTFRSDPPLSQDEILSLILFGSRDGSFGAEATPGREASTGAQAVGMAGGYITQGVNKAISGITSADITTRVDTSDSANPRPELAVQVSKDVSIRLGYNLGVPAPGDNPDRTELTVEWRFIRNWSLVTTVGDHGSTSTDVIWRLRY